MSLTRDDARSRLRPFGIVFEKSLHDLIRGIRSAKDPTAREKFVRDALAECRQEVKSPDMDTKTMAVIKLVYLEMYGYDMSWASFHVLEVMSSAKFQQKRIGYLAAAQSFRQDTDVLMLTTNLLKKDLGSAQPLEVSTALGGVASIVTPSLAQDVADDMVKMLNHSRPYIRKRAILAMYKIFLQYPEALRATFPRLREKLEDADPSVVSATVNVICELAKQTKSSTKAFVELAPPLYELLTTSHNNWMLIKILKLFSSLAPSEPRLKPKLLPPILQLMESTSAMSLMYECVNCIVSGGMMDESDYDLASRCVNKIRMFLEQSDQNLKYVGLLALTKVAQIHPQFVSDQEDLILECVDDPDLSIRERVLELLSGVVSENNIYSIVNRLMEQLRASSISQSDKAVPLLPKSYRTAVTLKVISMCATDTYALLPDFEWYIDTLVELVELSSGYESEVGDRIGHEMRNVAVRVPDIRSHALNAALKVISSAFESVVDMPQAVSQAVWIVGEYARFLSSNQEAFDTLLTLLTRSSTSSRTDVQASAIQAIVKVFADWAKSDQGWNAHRADNARAKVQSICDVLEELSTSPSFEVQERAAEFLELFKLVQQALDEYDNESSSAPLLLTLALPSMFNQYELNPIAPNSQRKIAVDGDLDLDTPLFPNCDYFHADFEEWANAVDSDDEKPANDVHEMDNGVEEWKPPSEEELERRRMERLEKQRDDPFYIPISSSGNTPVGSASRAGTPLLDSDGNDKGTSSRPLSSKSVQRPARRKMQIVQDESIGGDNDILDSSEKKSKSETKKTGKNLLKVSSRLGDLNLGDDDSTSGAAAAAELRSQLLASAPASTEVEVTHKKIKKKKKASSEKEDGKKTKTKKKKKKQPTEEALPESSTTEAN